MKLKGKFVIREVAGEILVIPVGAAALELNGMIVLNPVSRVIWDCLESETDVNTILETVLSRFEVSREEALADLEEFLNHLRKENLLSE